jgi:hypothetical protein
MTNLTTSEKNLIEILAKKDGWVDYAVSRKSEREFDLEIEGTSTKMGWKFRAWLVLAAIRELTMWTSPSISDLTDYPNMAYEGDWSGVRDTNEDSLWFIFHQHVVRKLNLK